MFGCVVVEGIVGSILDTVMAKVETPTGAVALVTIVAFIVLSIATNIILQPRVETNNNTSIETN
jgi:hypothetical protein